MRAECLLSIKSQYSLFSLVTCSECDLESLFSSIYPQHESFWLPLRSELHCACFTGDTWRCTPCCALTRCTIFLNNWFFVLCFKEQRPSALLCRSPAELILRGPALLELNPNFVREVLVLQRKKKGWQQAGGAAGWCTECNNCTGGLATGPSQGF